MELTLIVRSKEELAACVQAVIEGIHAGIVAAAAGGDGAMVNLPDDIVIKGRLVTELNADTITETDTTPANSVTRTNSTPAHTIVNTETIGSMSENSTTTPPTRVITRQEGGGDVTETSTEYTNY